MNEAIQAQIRGALDALQPVVHDLRTRGYDATAWVECRGDHYTVEVRIRVPALGVPIEATA